ncbi:hypothetical protein LCGC14_0446520 [marine sediment metagenome]|uniref:Bacteriophage T4 Gp32 single-stranded DNA-binding domain-containing protein n=1 Tax=marine sediment metagenome TaxID=412755 RepID=A0A0F9T2C0_9ZZZZ
MVGKADLDAMLTDYEKDQEERGDGASFFTPPAGKSHIRLLPPHDDAEGRVIVRGGNHWVGGRSVSCPIAFNVEDSCWLCSRAEELALSGDKRNEAEARDVQVKIRFFANVINPNDVDKGIMVWEFGRQVYDQILKYMGDPDYGDVSDTDEGYDLVVEKEGTGKKTRYSIRARRKPSGLDNDILALIDEDSEALKDLRNVRTFLDDDEMMELYEGAEDELPDEEDEEAPRRRRAATRTTVREEDEEEEKAAEDPDEDPDEGGGEPDEEAPRRRSSRRRAGASDEPKRERPGRPLSTRRTSSRRGASEVVGEVLASRKKAGGR